MTMLSIMAVLISLIVVAGLVVLRIWLIDIPPKAKLICQGWKIVQERESD